MEIRDTRNGSWYWVNLAVNACKHISHADKSVYGALASFAGCKDIHPSFDTIAERSNTSERQAKRSIKQLAKVGLISIVLGGGRGRSNVYDLLKCPKGCQNCTVYKGCQNEQERVTKKTIKGDRMAHQLDKEIDKEEDNSGTSPRVKNTHNPLGGEIIKAFEEVDPKNKTYYNNTTQRKACDYLLQEYSLEEIIKRVTVLPRTNKLPYFPRVNSPNDLKEKWVALQDAVDRLRKEKGKITKQTPNYIL